MRVIETTAEARWISARMETKNSEGQVIGIDNEGQSCIALIPMWGHWGERLLDGTKLEGGKFYKIRIEVEDEGGKQNAIKIEES